VIDINETFHQSANGFVTAAEMVISDRERLTAASELGRLTSREPPDFGEAPQEPDWPLRTTSSSVNREDAANLRNIFSVLEAICKYAERQRLSFGNGFVMSWCVNHNPRQFRDFADPAAIRLTFNVYGEVAHDRIVRRRGVDRLARAGLPTVLPIAWAPAVMRNCRDKDVILSHPIEDGVRESI
jgi:hypothetical protein